MTPKVEPPTARTGLTLVDALVVSAVVTVLAVLCLVLFKHAKARSSPVSCVNHLKFIELSFRQWSLDNGDRPPTFVPIASGGAMEWADAGNVFPIFMVMSNELNTPKNLVCPEDKRRTVATTFATHLPRGSRDIPFTNDALTSYFVGLDADETEPKSLRVGDCNLELNQKPISRGVLNLWTNAPVAWSADRHQNQGNVALAGGSVQGYSTARLREALVATRSATNRLVFPPPK